METQKDGLKIWPLQLCPFDLAVNHMFGFYATKLARDESGTHAGLYLAALLFIREKVRGI